MAQSICPHCQAPSGQHRRYCPRYGNDSIENWSATSTETAARLAEIIQETATFAGTAKQYEEWCSTTYPIKEEKVQFTDQEKFDYLKAMLKNEAEAIFQNNRRVQSLQFAVLCCSRFFE